MLEPYTLSSKALYELLKRKGVTHLHHANTISTSLTFIQQGALLSRKYVEENRLIQTPQDSDPVDKLYDVFDSVFMDGQDHHLTFGRNNYGPVIFKIKLELLNSDDFSKVFITRSNPYYWSKDGKKPLAEQFYDSLEEVEKDYIGESDNSTKIMFTFRSPEKKTRLADYIVSIIVDDPKLPLKLLTKKANPTDQLSSLAVKDPKLQLVTKTFEARTYLMPLLRKAISESETPEIPLLLRNNDYEGHLPCNCYYAYKHLQENKTAEFNKLFTRNGHYPELDIDELVK